MVSHFFGFAGRVKLPPSLHASSSNWLAKLLRPASKGAIPWSACLRHPDATPREAAVG